MNDALYIAATGMQAQQAQIDAIANNLANVNTQGFKRSRVSFTDLMGVAGMDTASDAQARPPAQGLGVGMAGVMRLFDPGELKKTDAPFDIGIRGDGFIEVTLPDGGSAYLRGGTLKVNRDGVLATQAGFPLKAGITIPEETQNITVGADGVVQLQVAGQARPVEAGRIELVRFANPGALQPLGDNLYRAAEAAGTPAPYTPGEDSAGLLAQGFLESANVNLVDEIVGLMLAQRAYGASVKLAQAADEIAAMANNLRRG